MANYSVNLLFFAVTTLKVVLLLYLAANLCHASSFCHQLLHSVGDATGVVLRVLCQWYLVVVLASSVLC